jgi:hypothetical protein
MQRSLDASTFSLISYTVKFSHCVFKHPFVLGYGRLEVLLCAFLTLALIEVRGQLLISATLPLEKELPVSVESEVEWALEVV